MLDKYIKYIQRVCGKVTNFQMLNIMVNVMMYGMAKVHRKGLFYYCSLVLPALALTLIYYQNSLIVTYNKTVLAC